MDTQLCVFKVVEAGTSDCVNDDPEISDLEKLDFTALMAMFNTCDCEQCLSEFMLIGGFKVNCSDADLPV